MVPYFQRSITDPSWRITTADPPSYQVFLNSQVVVKGSEFVEIARDRELPDLHPLLRRVTGT